MSQNTASKVESIENTANEKAEKAKSDASGIRNIRGEASTFAASLAPSLEDVASKVKREAFEGLVMGRAPKASTLESIDKRAEKAIERAEATCAVFGVELNDAAKKAIVNATHAQATLRDAQRETRHNLGLGGLRALEAMRSGRIVLK